jgi:hypothetical protein
MGFGFKMSLRFAQWLLIICTLDRDDKMSRRIVQKLNSYKGILHLFQHTIYIDARVEKGQAVA